MTPDNHPSPPADTGGDGRESARALYDELTDDLLYDPAIGYGTIMGHPCIRLAGRFVTCLERNGTGLILKLPADRVTAVIADGTGVPFTANRAPMREWVTIPTADRAVWQTLLEEAVAFARSTLGKAERS
ncbi:hypothetical protein JOF29_004192 [Kribbella aluminosa]|uniref:DNA-binding protein (MmcQ/YjbR family) n=1 Tax=Kribbella aluminosa TaxID=416017 RepID=A0ABS4UNG8_9ACTN|nr:hypothetical protein [Kribbella aluminosa]MBP2353109.1 hypothetical protein [Kribbella aluminosa]